MCGRSSLNKTEKELEARFQATFYSEEGEHYHPLPNFNIAPTHMHPIIRNTDPEQLRYFQWGLIPYWAKDAKIGYKMINARIETVLEKPAFKQAVAKRRCLVPFDGFYEWQKVPGGKQPYRITLKEESIFCVAGLWEQWIAPSEKTVFTFTLLTQPPNQLMEKIHNRMPAILLPEQEKLWLDMSLSPKDALQLIAPYPDDLLRAYKVDKRVGKVSENDVKLLAEWKGNSEGKQGVLF